MPQYMFPVIFMNEHDRLRLHLKSVDNKPPWADYREFSASTEIEFYGFLTWIHKYKRGHKTESNFAVACHVPLYFTVLREQTSFNVKILNSVETRLSVQNVS